jgi:hypothetical protein
VERDERVRGYEFAKDQYVRFTETELESLETESSNNIELKEFIPLSKIDPVYFESAYYVIRVIQAVHDETVFVWANQNELFLTARHKLRNRGPLATGQSISKQPIGFLSAFTRADGRWWTTLPCAMLVLIIVLIVFSVFNPVSFHRPLNLFRAELPKAWLVGIDMKGANGSYANLQGANLQGSNRLTARRRISNVIH